MLVTNPAQRAPLAEVMSHPWMVRGFMGSAAVHMVYREPIRSDELDRQVIKLMKGFEFGSEDEIERKLLQIIESDTYQRAVQHWERKRSIGHLSGNGSSTYNGTGFSNSSLAISFDSNTGKPDYASTATSASSTPMNSSVKKLKRFSGFDYYRRKLFSGSSPHSNSGGADGHGKCSESISFTHIFITIKTLVATALVTTVSPSILHKVSIPSFRCTSLLGRNLSVTACMDPDSSQVRNFQ